MSPAAPEPQAEPQEAPAVYQGFSPLEVGKLWFYTALHKLAPVSIKQGWETASMRDQLGFKKTGKKLAEVWEAHCIDAWILAWSHVGERSA